MTTIIILKEEEERVETIDVVGPMDDPEPILSAHGYDPEETNYSVQKSEVQELRDRIEELENAQP